MAQHGALSVVLDIKPGKIQVLRDHFKEIEAAGIENNSVIPFAKLTTIHFARFVVFDEGTDAYGKPFPARMSFTTNYDLPFENHLKELIDHAGKGLWSIFSYCEKFPEGQNYSPVKLSDFIKANNIPANTFYVGVGPRTVSQVRNESILREEIENFVDTQKLNFKGKSAVAIRNSIIAYVHAHPQLQWAKSPAPKKSAGENSLFYGKLIALVLLVIVLLPIIIPFLLIWLTIILIIEINTKDLVCKIDKNHVRELVERENTIVQQQFSAMGNVKPGFFRKSTMLFLLKMTDFLAPYLFSKGKLSGIPTVQFARWIIVNEGKQMIFLSNFDGNSENYLRDFINIAGRQLTLMFCHTIGYPKTRLMWFGGAKDAEGFMAWARSFQVISNIWYSANKNVSVKNIFHNSEIRNGLYGNMSEEQAKKWLSKL